MIVVAGEALVDLVVAPDGSVAASLGGGPFNTARAGGRLGGSVAFVGAVSNDRFGDSIRSQLSESGVHCALVQATELPTTLAVAELDAKGSATYRFYMEGTSAPNLRGVDLPAGVSTLHAGTLGLVLEPMATVIESMVSRVRANVLVFVDVNLRPAAIVDRDAYVARLDRILRRADVIKVSTEDLELLGVTSESLASNGAVVLQTNGGDDVSVLVGRRTFDVPVPSVAVVDTIGAGDAFGGGFVAWWDQGGLTRSDLGDLERLRAAVAAAVEVAAITCTRRGADPPHATDLGPRWRPPPN